MKEPHVDVSVLVTLEHNIILVSFNKDIVQITLVYKYTQIVIVSFNKEIVQVISHTQVAVWVCNIIYKCCVDL